MKTTLQTLALASVFALASCGEEQAPEAVTAPAEPIKKDSVTTAPKLDTFTVQTDLSSVNWMGSSPVKGHKGMLKLSQGWLGFNAGKIAQGEYHVAFSGRGLPRRQDRAPGNTRRHQGSTRHCDVPSG